MQNFTGYVMSSPTFFAASLQQKLTRAVREHNIIKVEDLFDLIKLKPFFDLDSKVNAKNNFQTAPLIIDSSSCVTARPGTYLEGAIGPWPPLWVGRIV